MKRRLLIPFVIIIISFCVFFFYFNSQPKPKTTDDTYCKQENASERAKCLFNIDKIEKLELTSKKPLDLQDHPDGYNRPPTCGNNLYRYLLKYPEFREKYKEKLTWYNDNLENLLIETLEQMKNNKTIREAVEKNENLYKTWGNQMKNLSVWQNDEIWRLKNWDEHLDYLKRFMTGRAKWLLDNFEGL